MTRYRFEFAFGAVLVALFVAVCLWQSPSLWSAPLSKAEIDAYMTALDTTLVQPAGERKIFIERLQRWAEQDDGRAVLMLNLMRYNRTLTAVPPLAGFSGTPVQANEIYEKAVTPLALKQGELPLVAGRVQGQNLVGYEPAMDGWDRVVVMRAPSRRAFIRFMADPAYGPLVPYKTAAAQVLLIPIDADLVLPELRWIVGFLFLVVFLSVGWIRASLARR